MCSRQLEILTDHKPLVSIINKNIPNVLLCGLQKQYNIYEM